MEEEVKQQAPLGITKAGSVKSKHGSDAGSEKVIDVGNCPEHQRPFEAFCDKCKVYFNVSRM